MRLNRVAGLSMAALLAVTAAAWAVFPPPIKDDGKFFKPATLEKANLKIRALYEKYQKDVVIETMASLTPEQEKALKADGKDKFFEKFAEARVKALGVNGVYLMICKEPRRIRIATDESTRKAGLTNSESEQLVRRITAKFRESDFDAGLLAGLDFLEATLQGRKK